ncbi:MAG: peptidase family [Myxococcaceae bacterium]|nr:peptidase family [Myxococcaceae bacterium]
MRSRAITASVFTLSLLSAFVFILLTPITFALAQSAGDLGAGLILAIAIGLTIAINGLMWLISPWLMDLTNRWFYRCRDMPFEEFAQYRPAVAQFLYGASQRHGVKVPTLKLIDDMNPTAYCYGSTADRSRMVLTRGLLHYLNDDELAAVVAHELGHIVHRDFIVMTLASTLVQILWQIYVVAKSIRPKGNDSKGIGEAAALVALVAYAFWWVSQYALLYLSRVREYYADEFAGAETRNPNALSMALVKVAYGLARQPNTEFSRKLMGGTRALGVADPGSARSTGFAYAAAHQGGHAMAGSLAGHETPEVQATADGIARIEKVFLFDLHNPWAAVLELGSTHPLTGKRIKVLCEQSAAMSIQPLFQFQPIDAYGRPLDHARLRGNFALEVLVWFAPHLGAAAAIALGTVGAIAGSTVLSAAGFAGVILGVGLGMTLKGFWRFPTLGQPAMTSVLELMMDPYASPLRGRPVAVQGTLIGRADAGSYVSEDMMMEDPQGGLMMLNYEHWLPLFGNAWFGWKTVTRLIGQPFQAVGWFRRGIGQQIDLDELRTQGESVSSYTALWGRMGGVVVALLGAVVLAGAMLVAVGSELPSTPATPTGTVETPTAPAPELAPSGGK